MNVPVASLNDDSMIMIMLLHDDGNDVNSDDIDEDDNKAPKKKCYVALSRPTVKCEKTGSGFFFFFFFMSDLGEEFAKICIQWLKKALA